MTLFPGRTDSYRFPNCLPRGNILRRPNLLHKNRIDLVIKKMDQFMYNWSNLTYFRSTYPMNNCAYMISIRCRTINTFPLFVVQGMFMARYYIFQIVTILTPNTHSLSLSLSSVFGTKKSYYVDKTILIWGKFVNWNSFLFISIHNY